MNKQSDVARRIVRARTALLLDHPWFGSLALRLQVTEEKGLGTVATDGSHFYYDPDFLETVSDKELIGLMAHEVSHCALGHPYRKQSREQRMWNEACDIVINKKLRDEGFSLPFTELQAEENTYQGMASEQVYSLRQKKKSEQGQSGQGQGKGQPAPGQSQMGCCDMRPAPQGSEGEEAGGTMTETDWQIAAEQAAAVARKAGNMPASMDREIKASRETKTDWRTILRRFIENSVPSDYSWTNPNRRFVSQGIYLPGVIRENMPRIGVAVDTSGSINAQMLAQFAAELTAIVQETRPEDVEVVYCDTKVHGVEHFSPDDGEIVLKAKGGGGTSFDPALKHFKEDPPACVIYLTDLEASRPEEPDFPVLWAIPEWQRDNGWFGETVRLTE